MTTSRRDFLTNVAFTGAVASTASSGIALGSTPTPERQTNQDRPHGGIHSLLERDHPYIFVDACMQIWPDADFANAHRHGVTAYAVTAWNPNARPDTALEGLMYWHLVARQNPNLLVAETVDDIRRAKRGGKAALLLAAQDGDWIEGALHRVEAFKRLGLRMMLLAYNRSNQLCDGCLDRTDGGLTRFGELVVKECNRVGIVLDCSHIAKRSALETIDISEHPCVYSHSNPSALVPNPRNIDDDQIKACAARGGVVALVAWGPLVMRPDRLHWPTVDEYIDHIDHVTYPDHEQDPWGAPELPGVSRLYGQQVTPDIRSHMRNLNGFSDYAEVTNLIGRLDRRGYKVDDIEKFLGGNLLRVFEQVWK